MSEINSQLVLSPYDLNSGWTPQKDKSLGQVLTPKEVGKIMARWVMSAKPKSVLDPAVGSGNLLYECWCLDPEVKMRGVDADRKAIQRAAAFLPKKATLSLGDYLKASHPSEAIIANPPYVKIQNLNFSEKDWCELERSLQVKLDRFTNLYALFLLKIWNDLKTGGIAAVIVPAEFLNANFGRGIKSQLQGAMRPRGIVIFDPKLNLFAGALTTSCILFLRKEKAPVCRHPILCQKVDSLTEAADFVEALIREELSGFVDVSQWNPEDKWLNSFFNQGPKTESPIQLNSTVAKYFKCRRGIATGANDYFCLSRPEIEKRGLSPSDFDLCITKATDASGIIFDERKFSTLTEQGRKCFLLNPKKESAALSRYLEEGMAAKVHERHLPSHRPIWYLPENRDAADIWVAVFSREEVKYIWNKGRAKNLTCFHGLYSKEKVKAHVLLMLLFLNSSLAKESFAKVNRFYGDGLNKLEPKDVEAMPCPELPTLTEKEEQQLENGLAELETAPDRETAADALFNRFFKLR